jgi:hypothetical protein
MKAWRIGFVLTFLCAFGFAQTGRKPCDDLKSDIAKKLAAKNVSNYSLEVVDKGKEGESKAVGSCDGGTKSIVYSKADTPAAKEPATDNKANNKKETK